MHFKTFRIGSNLFLGLLALTGFGFEAGFGAAPPQTVPPPVAGKQELLVWDALQKEANPPPGAPTADFVFAVTNVSDSEVIINSVRTSCGCTVAKLPSQPWILAPHTNGEIKVSVNLAGKFGTIYKTITVISTNAPKTLTVKVNLPQAQSPLAPAMVRSKNQQMAVSDRQAVFKNAECAKCHAAPAATKMGAELYASACGICHEAALRATMVPNLHALKHPTFYAYWKHWIESGKPGTLMPAFASAQGGPLSLDQIESLAEFLTKTIPQNMQAAALPPPTPPTMTAHSATGASPIQFHPLTKN
jgi:cytochrome c553